MSKKTIMYWVLVLSLFLIMSLFVDYIPPRAKTENVLASTHYRIFLFYKKYKRCPNRLDELPKRDGYNNSFLDGSGNNILYSLDNGIVTLVGQINSDNSIESKKSITFKCNTFDFYGDDFYSSTEKAEYK